MCETPYCSDIDSHTLHSKTLKTASHDISILITVKMTTVVY